MMNNSDDTFTQHLHELFEKREVLLWPLEHIEDYLDHCCRCWLERVGLEVADLRSNVRAECAGHRVDRLGEVKAFAAAAEVPERSENLL